MKMNWLISLLMLSLGSGAFAAGFSCTDADSGYKLNVKLNGAAGMGITRGTGTLTLDGQKVGTLSCTYSSGITVTLKCTNEDYQVSGAGSLSSLPLFYNGQKIATLTCE